MNLKIWATIAVLVTSTSASAKVVEQFNCSGKLNNKDKTKIEIQFHSDKKVVVTDHNGDEHTLPLTNTTKKSFVYTDNGWDGYGGYIRLLVPKDYDEVFRAKFQIETYSEIGHVNSDVFWGDCQRIDN